MHFCSGLSIPIGIKETELLSSLSLLLQQRNYSFLPHLLQFCHCILSQATDRICRPTSSCLTWERMYYIRCEWMPSFGNYLDSFTLKMKAAQHNSLKQWELLAQRHSVASHRIFSNNVAVRSSKQIMLLHTVHTFHFFHPECGGSMILWTVPTCVPN